MKTPFKYLIIVAIWAVVVEQILIWQDLKRIARQIASNINKPDIETIDEVKLPKENNYYKGEYQEEVKQ